MVGNPACSWIVHQPPDDFRLSGRAKVIESAPGVALASRMAGRSEPAPPSPVLVTVKTAGAVRSSSPSTRGRKGGRGRTRRLRAGVRRVARGRSQEGARMVSLHCVGGLRYNGGDITWAR